MFKMACMYGHVGQMQISSWQHFKGAAPELDGLKNLA